MTDTITCRLVLSILSLLLFSLPAQAADVDAIEKKLFKESMKSSSNTPPKGATTEKIKCKSLPISSAFEIDADAAKIRAKEFMDATLKAPSTARWASYNEFAVAQKQDEECKIMKDVWDVAGYVDAQNSFGAMLRTNFIITVQKKTPEWELIKLRTY